MEIVYLVADALDTPLHMLDNGTIRGCKSRSIKLGPWTVVSDAVVCSDELKNTLASFLFRIKSDVWAYITCEADGNMRAYVFDGQKWGMKSKDVTKFGTGKILDTLKKIKSEVRAIFAFNKDNSEWTQIELDSVDGDLSG